MIKERLKYVGFEDLPIYNFYKIIETQNVAYFYKDYQKGDELELDDEEQIELLDLFQNIFNERLDYAQDIKTKEYYRKLEEMTKLSHKLYRIKNTFNTINDIPHTSLYFKLFLGDFEKEGWKYSEEVKTPEDRLKCLEWMKVRIKRFENKVNIKKLEYEDVLNPPKREDGNKFDLMREKILLEEVLNRVIDIYICSVKEWTALILRAEEKAKLQKAQLEKTKNKRI